jgi:hypothetical protein
LLYLQLPLIAALLFLGMLPYRCNLPLTAEINELLTRCEVELQPDGSPTPATQLQHWPRHAPPPKSLLIATDRRGSQHPFVPFLISCMQQPSEERLLRGVTKLQLEVPILSHSC